MANEAAWAQAELQQPPTPAACNSACQMQHDSFLLQIQRADSTTPGSILPGRKLLDANDVIQQVGGCPAMPCGDKCCIHCDGAGNANYASCPPFAPYCEVYCDPPPTPPPCRGVEICDSCSVQDGTPCADVVRDDLPSTRITGYDCTTCDNSASAQYAAASGGDGSSPSPDYGSIISNVLRISIALLA